MNDTMNLWHNVWHCPDDRVEELRDWTLLGYSLALLIIITMFFYAGSYIQSSEIQRHLVQCSFSFKISKIKQFLFNLRFQFCTARDSQNTYRILCMLNCLVNLCFLVQLIYSILFNMKMLLNFRFTFGSPAWFAVTYSKLVNSGKGILIECYAVGYYLFFTSFLLL